MALPAAALRGLGRPLIPRCLCVGAVARPLRRRACGPAPRALLVAVPTCEPSRSGPLKSGSCVPARPESGLVAAARHVAAANP
eukprot:CAMPEP_0172902446 /NCGR_PEP_ID=MMETSP1075-20121228/168422_1 /TAXON_ID=2916 /ORGANISM="Ceratium fusus, Strain PA161109" /LENGTH=82 /DNA_ID=CAMNT_0013759041 /DNA_START=778 /DNA_END=1022 /DNA_ORIENTATION=-